MQTRDVERLVKLLEQLADEIDEDYAARIDRAVSMGRVESLASDAEHIIAQVERVARWAKRYETQ